MRIIVEVQDLPPRRTTRAVASYVRAVLDLRALRQEVALKLLEVERCKQVINSRLYPEALWAETRSLLEQLGIDVVGDNHSGS